MRCTVCGRKLRSPKAIAAGMGSTCAKRAGSRSKHADGSSGPIEKIPPRIVFMSRPGTSHEQRRSYLVKFEGEPYALVHIYPDPDRKGGRRGDCDCEIGRVRKSRCKHTDAAGPVDHNRYKEFLI